MSKASSPTTRGANALESLASAPLRVSRFGRAPSTPLETARNRRAASARSGWCRTATSGDGALRRYPPLWRHRSRSCSCLAPSTTARQRSGARRLPLRSEAVHCRAHELPRDDLHVSAVARLALNRRRPRSRFTSMRASSHLPADHRASGARDWWPSVRAGWQRWRQRIRTRVELRDMDARALADIGMDPETARHERHKFFWQG
jgi:uncharacterized protein YjiS (DUF1127 family)